MSGSNWRYVLAAVGWLILVGADKPAGRGDNAQVAQQVKPAPAPISTPTPTPASTPTYTPYPDRYADSCYAAPNHDTGDLCAQWRAAIAGEWAMRVSVLATIFSAVTVMGLIVTIWQTRGALGEARRGNRITLDIEKRARRAAREAAADTQAALAHAERNADETAALVRVSEEAARRAADIARDGQRAWVTINIRPQLIKSSGIGGLYFMVDFVAENIGDSIATHFGVDYEAFFKGQHESIEDFNERIEARIDEFKTRFNAPMSCCLIPKDINVSRFWDSRTSEDINWWKGTIFGYDVTHLVFVAVVFYRTIHHPEAVQMSWRSWYLSEKSTNDGQASTFIKKNTDTLKADQLSADPLRMTMMHEPYAAALDEE